MAHTYTSCLVHFIFSTRRREPTLTREMRMRLWPFIGGIARKHDMRALAVGGYVEHAHMLLSLPPKIGVAKAMELIKSGSSKFVNETYSMPGRFHWQEGYGAFSVTISGADETVAYIERQEEHHRARSFQEEYLAFLDKHHIKYDERYVFD